MSQIWDIHEFDEVDSTNKIVKDAITRGEKCGFCAVAKVQKNGYGMRGHSWQSSLGGLYMSLLLDTVLSGNDLSTIPHSIAGVCMEAIRPILDVELAIKHPNDIVLARSLENENEKREKLVGISTEVYKDRLCVGIGVNVFRNEEDSEDCDFGENRAVFVEDFANTPVSIILVRDLILTSLSDKLSI